MSYQEAKKIYESFLASGDLHELFQGLTGDWDKDKDRFIEEYQYTVKGFDSSDMDDEYFEDDFNEFF